MTDTLADAMLTVATTAAAAAAAESEDDFETAVAAERGHLHQIDGIGAAAAAAAESDDELNLLDLESVALTERAAAAAAESVAAPAAATESAERHGPCSARKGVNAEEATLVLA